MATISRRLCGGDGVASARNDVDGYWRTDAIVGEGVGKSCVSERLFTAIRRLHLLRAGYVNYDVAATLAVMVTRCDR